MLHDLDDRNQLCVCVCVCVCVVCLFDIDILAIVWDSIDIDIYMSDASCRGVAWFLPMLPKHGFMENNGQWVVVFPFSNPTLLTLSCATSSDKQPSNSLWPPDRSAGIMCSFVYPTRRDGLGTCTPSGYATKWHHFDVAQISFFSHKYVAEVSLSPMSIMCRSTSGISLFQTRCTWLGWLQTPHTSPTRIEDWSS